MTHAFPLGIWDVSDRIAQLGLRTIWSGRKKVSNSERGVVWTAYHRHQVVQKSENMRSGKDSETWRTYVSTVWLAVKKSSGYLIDLRCFDRTSCSIGL